MTIFFEFNTLILKEKNIWKSLFFSFQICLFIINSVCFIFFQRFSISMENLIYEERYHIQFIGGILVLMCALLVIIWSIYRILIQKGYTMFSSTLKSEIVIYLVAFIVFIGCIIVTSSYWLIDTFGDIDIEQLIYTASNSLGGSATQQIFTFIDGPLVTSLFCFNSCLLFLQLINLLKQKIPIKIPKFIKISISILFPILLILSAVAIGVSQFGFDEVKAYVVEQSTLIEKEYVDASKVKLTFPDKKRNLIYIFVESFEGTYTSKEFGGAMDNNLLNGLIDYPDSINFSNSNKIGGALTYPGTNFTVGGMVAQTSGMPLKSPVQAEDLNAFIQDETESKGGFLPGVTTIGDILHKEGYNQTIIMGSDASFGGRKQYFTEHGKYKIIDYEYARDNGFFPEDYRVWWGYEDEKLFEYAKNEVTELSSSPDPFNLTLLTADTHFEDGYIYDSTPIKYDDQYSNVISFTSDQLISFLDWCKEQDFYENTTIVISGDHLSMGQGFFSEVSDKYTRNVFNLFINQPNITTNSKNRQFSTMDLFPTTLKALGVKINGNRLGLGTDLFSDEKTLTEQYGYDTLYKDFSLRSSFYIEKIFK